MPSKRRKFHRPLGKHRYRKLVLIAAEGVKTEPQYFSRFNGQNSVIRVHCIKRKHDSSPPHTLRQMKEYLNKNRLRSSDEAWLVVDKDHWADEQLTQLHNWAKEHDQYGLAVSNPKFEYWLLLHFEDGTNIQSSQHLCARLKRHLPDYNKEIETRKITRQGIDNAICRARRRDQPPCADWPREFGGTTVYRLVENILAVD